VLIFRLFLLSSFNPTEFLTKVSDRDLQSLPQQVLRGESPRLASATTAQPAIFKSMSDETSDGTAYLLALKGSTHSRDSTAVAPAREIGTAPTDLVSVAPKSAAGQPFSGVDKRRARRYRCEGSAELRQAGGDVHTWATFKDISMHGCYVEMTGCYAVGTVIDLKLQANGFRIQAEGLVRVSYPGLGMGIAFQRMSEEDRKSLKELLLAISKPTTAGSGNVPSLESSASKEPMPAVLNPASAMRALVAYFATRDSITRPEFLRVLHSSQETEPAKP
jgi:hypothetical protein